MKTYKRIFNEVKQSAFSIFKKKTFYIVTGSFGSGKSTYTKALTKKLKTGYAQEYQVGIDISENKWWEEIMFYGYEYNTTIIETHLAVQGKDMVDGWGRNIDISKAKVKLPPDNIKFIFMDSLSPEVLRKRNAHFDDYEDDEIEYYNKWYEILKKKLSKNVVKKL